MLMQLLTQALALGRCFEHITSQMRLAALPRTPLKVALHSGDKSGVGIRDHHVHAWEAAALEPGEEGGPTALRLAIPQLDAQNLAVPSRVDADGNEGCAGALLTPV
jgi:hypothetical protein